MVFICFAVYVLANNTQVVPYFESCMVAWRPYTTLKICGVKKAAVHDIAKLFISVVYYPFQCVNGHLMCAGCFTHLLADARLKDEQPTCPNCRCEISKNLCSRNLAVEKAVSELPEPCMFCPRKLPRNLLDHHQRRECVER